MTIDTELQGQVDAQLLEQGSFSMLDFLMDGGRLLVEDYERWRREEIGSLDEVLMGSGDKIRAELEELAGYARKIGLVQEQQSFQAGRGEDPLRISADATLGGLIAARFVPAQNAPQLDLFFDNPVVALTNGIVRALSTGNHEAAQRALDRLYALAPTHADLPAYDRLLAAHAYRGRRIDTPRQTLTLLKQITPAARRLMGTHARDLLTPLWRELAEAMRGLPFQADEPELHRSFSLCRARDWDGVMRSVLDEPRWWLHAPLCLRLAQSAFQLRRRPLALSAWFHLCWRDPGEAADALDLRRHCDAGMAASWQRFIDSAADADVAWGAADFPAWLLLQEPGLTRQIAVDLPTGTTPAEQAYRCIHRWIDARRAGRQDEEMALRKALKAVSPTLFESMKRTV